MLWPSSASRFMGSGWLEESRAHARSNSLLLCNAFRRPNAMPHYHMPFIAQMPTFPCVIPIHSQINHHSPRQTLRCYSAWALCWWWQSGSRDPTRRTPHPVAHSPDLPTWRETPPHPTRCQMVSASPAPARARAETSVLRWAAQHEVPWAAMVRLHWPMDRSNPRRRRC